jgi:hypothetical protein
VVTGDALATPYGRLAFWLGGGLFVGASVFRVVQLIHLGGVGDEYLSTLLTVGPGAAGPRGRLSNILHLVGVLSFAAGGVIFALGLRGRGSVVGRRPIGLIALLVYSVAPVAVWIATSEGPFPGRTNGMGTYVLWAVQVVAGLIAVIEIARIGAVPGWWRFMPLTIFVVIVALMIISTLVSISFVFNPSYEGRPTSLEINMPTLFLVTIAPFVLGVTAITLAAIAGRRAGSMLVGEVAQP